MYLCNLFIKYEYLHAILLYLNSYVFCFKECKIV